MQYRRGSAIISIVELRLSPRHTGVAPTSPVCLFSFGAYLPHAPFFILFCIEQNWTVRCRRRLPSKFLSFAPVGIEQVLLWYSHLYKFRHSHDGFFVLHSFRLPFLCSPCTPVGGCGLLPDTAIYSRTLCTGLVVPGLFLPPASHADVWFCPVAVRCHQVDGVAARERVHAGTAVLGSRVALRGCYLRGFFIVFHFFSGHVSLLSMRLSRCFSL